MTGIGLDAIAQALDLFGPDPKDLMNFVKNHLGDDFLRASPARQAKVILHPDYQDRLLEAIKAYLIWFDDQYEGMPNPRFEPDGSEKQLMLFRSPVRSWIPPAAAPGYQRERTSA